MLVGSLLSAETSTKIKALGCNTYCLIKQHLEELKSSATIRVLIWSGIDKNGLIPLDDAYLQLLKAYPSKFEVRISKTDDLSDQLSHFILASPMRGDESDCIQSSDENSAIGESWKQCWGLRIERPHKPSEQDTFSAWNSFAFEAKPENKDYLAIRDGPRLLGFFNSLWNRAAVVEPEIAAQVTI
jgi:hypothetical protein